MRHAPGGISRLFPKDPGTIVLGRRKKVLVIGQLVCSHKIREQDGNSGNSASCLCSRSPLSLERGTGNRGERAKRS